MSSRANALHHYALAGRPCQSSVGGQERGDRGPWRNVEHVEFATLDWVDWFNNRRLLEPIGHIPPVEFEQLYYQHQGTQAMVA